MTPNGKWLFLWQIKYCALGNTPQIVAKALELGLTGISIKCTQTDSFYNLRWDGDQYVDDRLPPLVMALHQAGLKVNGWGWVEGDKPIPEAITAANRIHQLNLDGWDVDAEGAYKGKPVAARIYMGELRARLGSSFPIGLTSYRFPAYHPEFPWVEFCESVDYHLPQVYWNPPYPPNYGPIPELMRSFAQLRSIRDIPIFPAGRAYIGDGHPDPRPQELTDFMEEAKSLNLPGISFWAMDFLYLHSGGADRAIAIRDFEYTSSPPPPPPPPPEPVCQFQVLTAGVNVREGPGTNYPVVGWLNKDTTGEVLETGGTNVWYKIGEKRWIASFYNGTHYSKLV